MIYDLFAKNQDAYPTLPAYRRWAGALATPEAALARFLHLTLHFASYARRENAGPKDEVAALLDSIWAERITPITPDQRGWLTVQDNVIGIMERALARSRGATFFLRIEALREINRVASQNGVADWFKGKAHRRLLNRIHRMAKEAKRAISRERIRRYRTEMKPGIRVIMRSTYRDEQRLSVVREVRGRGLVLAGGMRAEFHVTDGRTYGEWRLTGGKFRGESIRRAMACDREIGAALAGLWTPESGIEKPRPSQILDAEFRSQNAPDERIVDQAKGGTLRLGNVAGATLPNASYGSLAAYMIRRFGYPTHGSDDDKDIMGAWMLTTPVPGFCIEVCPSASGIRHAFSYALTRQTSEEIKAATDRWWSHVRTRANDLEAARNYLSVTGKYYRAARVTFADLMRPVAVRDQWLTAEGLFDEKTGTFTEEGLVGRAVRSQTCNYGVDPRTLENIDGVSDLLEAAAGYAPSFPKALSKAARALKTRTVRLKRPA